MVALLLVGLRGSRAGGATSPSHGLGSKKRAAASILGLMSALVGLTERITSGGDGFSLPAAAGLEFDDQDGPSDRGRGTATTRLTLGSDAADELAVMSLVGGHRASTTVGCRWAEGWSAQEHLKQGQDV